MPMSQIPVRDVIIQLFYFYTVIKLKLKKKIFLCLFAMIALALY